MDSPSPLTGPLKSIADSVLAQFGEVVRAVMREEMTRAIGEVRPAATEDLLDTRAAVKFTGRSASTLRRWRALGLPAIQTEAGGKLIYSRADLIEFLRAQSAGRTSSTCAHTKTHGSKTRGPPARWEDQLTNQEGNLSTDAPTPNDMAVPPLNGTTTQREMTTSIFRLSILPALNGGKQTTGSALLYSENDDEQFYGFLTTNGAVVYDATIKINGHDQKVILIDPDTACHYAEHEIPAVFDMIRSAEDLEDDIQIVIKGESD